MSDADDKDWDNLCKTAEALDLIVPETVPFLPTHAKKIRKQLDLAESILKLVADLDKDHNSGWSGLSAPRSNAVSAAHELVYGDIDNAERIYKMAQGQYEDSKKYRHLAIGEELLGIAERIQEEWPDQARELSELSERIENERTGTDARAT